MSIEIDLWYNISTIISMSSFSSHSNSSKESGDFRSRLIVIITIIIATIVGIIFALFELYRPRPNESTQVKAITVITPLIYLAGPLLGDQVDGYVEPLFPNANLHSYTPVPSDIKKALKANVWFILASNQVALEKQFIEKTALNNKAPPQVISGSEGIDFIQDSNIDIHIWMSPRQASTIVKNFQKGLISRYPENSLFYRARGGKLQAQLRELDNSYRNTLSTCQYKTVVVTHKALAYLARDYGLEEWSIYSSGVEASDISPSRLIETTEKIRELGVTHIFYTEEASLRIIKVIASELGVEILSLYTMENSLNSFDDEFLEMSYTLSEGYITVMEKNLSHLAQGLNCSN